MLRKSYYVFIKSKIRSNSATIDPQNSKLKITKWLKITFTWMTSPACQLTIFAIRHCIYLKETTWGMSIFCLDWLSQLSWPISGQNCRICRNNLQMSGPKIPKLVFLLSHISAGSLWKETRVFYNAWWFCKHLKYVSKNMANFWRWV